MIAEYLLSPKQEIHSNNGEALEYIREGVEGMEKPKDRKEDFRMLSSRPDASAPIMNSMQLNLPTPSLYKTGPLSITPAWGGTRGTLLTELLLASC